MNTVTLDQDQFDQLIFQIGYVQYNITETRLLLSWVFMVLCVLLFFVIVAALGRLSR